MANDSKNELKNRRLQQIITRILQIDGVAIKSIKSNKSNCNNQRFSSSETKGYFFMAYKKDGITPPLKVPPHFT